MTSQTLSHNIPQFAQRFGLQWPVCLGLHDAPTSRSNQRPRGP